MIIFRLANLPALLVMPFLLVGVINRVKSLWSGRKGPPLFQSAYDVLRLLHKRPVYSHNTTPLFRIAPYVLLLTSLSTSLVAPLLGSTPMLAFAFDFVWLAYAWALGRMATMLAALDTGSSFEGMGAAREATLSSLLEPALFLVAGTLCLLSGKHTLHEALAAKLSNPAAVVAWTACIVALLIILQVETARMPVDDPATHLELTMIHEVMILDHSGPELGAIQAATAIKFFIGASFIATMLNPVSGSGSLASALLQLALCILVAAVVGSVESLIARLKLRALPYYIVIAIASGAVGLLATTWRVRIAP